MIPEKIREINNPYYPITHKIASHDFIGRKKEQDDICSMLKDYEKTCNLSNLLVSGEKSIGKSTLLSIYRQTFEDNNFFVFEVELSRDADIDLNEFDFFKEVIDSILSNNQFKNCNTINDNQINIWNALTDGNYSHDSNISDRKISFATQYSNYINDVNLNFSYQKIENDFKNILDDLTLNMGMDISGVAILIDEFQELARNTTILDTLRKLSENLSGITVVGAGLPEFYDNPNFEKFSRTSIPIRLKRLEKSEIIKLICKPFEKIADYKRYEILRWFDAPSIREIVERSNGNPLHVKILCQKMFERFKYDRKCTLIKLDRQVMDDVMVFYSSISKNSNIIRLALETLTKEQLKNFSLLYRYECFSIKAAVLLTLAFSEITPHNEEREKKVFLDAFEDLWGFKLFNFSGGVNVLEDLLEKSINELSQVEYSFIGDPIDKLYAAYFYEDLTGEKLESNCEYLFEDMLAIKYGNQLQSSGISVIDGSIPVFSTADEIKIYNVNFDKSDTYDSGENIINDLDRLVDLSSEDNIKDSDKIKEIKDLSSKYDLAFPSFMAEKLELLGYYYVISDLKIKGKRRIVNNLFPVKDFDGIIPSIKKVFSSPGNIFDGLDEYMVEVNNIFIYWMPRKPLVAIFLFDIQGELDSLIQRVKNRNFDGAINSADRILKLDTRFIKNEVRTRVETLNNYGFCLININSLERAKSILESCGKHFLVSRCNLAYIHFLNGETELTKEILNRIIKKNSGHDHEVSFIHLAITSDGLSFENMIVENTNAFNLSCWNMALISGYEGRDQSVVNSYLKRAKLSPTDKLIHNRVKSWTALYDGDKSIAINIAEEALLRIEAGHYMEVDIKRDLSIFKKP